jgi:hypothetical protein
LRYLAFCFSLSAIAMVWHVPDLLTCRGSKQACVQWWAGVLWPSTFCQRWSSGTT